MCNVISKKNYISYIYIISQNCVRKIIPCLATVWVFFFQQETLFSTPSSMCAADVGPRQVRKVRRLLRCSQVRRLLALAPERGVLGDDSWLVAWKIIQLTLDRGQNGKTHVFYQGMNLQMVGFHICYLLISGSGKWCVVFCPPKKKNGTLEPWVAKRGQ